MRDQALHLAPEPAEAEAQGGDRALEFDLFFEHERARLFRALCLVTRNRFEAEELSQDAFLAVYERWDRVRGMEDPTGYLYRTAMNVFRSWHRRSALAAKRAIGLTRADDSIEQLEEQDAGDPGPRAAHALRVRPGRGATGRVVRLHVVGCVPARGLSGDRRAEQPRGP